ncbi:unnamed protein product [Eretmochelys imbricata]
MVACRYVGRQIASALRREDSGTPLPPKRLRDLGDKKDVTRRPVVAPLDSVPPGRTPLVPAERGAPGRPS